MEWGALTGLSVGSGRAPKWRPPAGSRESLSWLTWDLWLIVSPVGNVEPSSRLLLPCWRRAGAPGGQGGQWPWAMGTRVTVAGREAVPAYRFMSRKKRCLSNGAFPEVKHLNGKHRGMRGPGRGWGVGCRLHVPRYDGLASRCRSYREDTSRYTRRTCMEQ